LNNHQDLTNNNKAANDLATSTATLTVTATTTVAITKATTTNTNNTTSANFNFSSSLVTNSQFRSETLLHSNSITQSISQQQQENKLSSLSQQQQQPSQPRYTNQDYHEQFQPIRLHAHRNARKVKSQMIYDNDESNSKETPINTPFTQMSTQISPTHAKEKTVSTSQHQQYNINTNNDAQQSKYQQSKEIEMFYFSPESPTRKTLKKNRTQRLLMGFRRHFVGGTAVVKTPKPPADDVWDNDKQNCASIKSETKILNTATVGPTAATNKMYESATFYFGTSQGAETVKTLKKSYKIKQTSDSVYRPLALDNNGGIGGEVSASSSQAPAHYSIFKTLFKSKKPPPPVIRRTCPNCHRLNAFCKCEEDLEPSSSSPNKTSQSAKEQQNVTISQLDETETLVEPETTSENFPILKTANERTKKRVQNVIQDLYNMPTSVSSKKQPPRDELSISNNLAIIKKSESACVAESTETNELNEPLLGKNNHAEHYYDDYQLKANREASPINNEEYMMTCKKQTPNKNNEQVNNLMLAHDQALAKTYNKKKCDVISLTQQRIRTKERFKIHMKELAITLNEKFGGNQALRLDTDKELQSAASSSCDANNSSAKDTMKQKQLQAAVRDSASAPTALVKKRRRSTRIGWRPIVGKQPRSSKQLLKEISALAAKKNKPTVQNLMQNLKLACTASDAEASDNLTTTFKTSSADGDLNTEILDAGETYTSETSTAQIIAGKALLKPKVLSLNIKEAEKANKLASSNQALTKAKIIY
jgi:hypothetical protein